MRPTGCSHLEPMHSSSLNCAHDTPAPRSASSTEPTSKAMPASVLSVSSWRWTTPPVAAPLEDGVKEFTWTALGLDMGWSIYFIRVRSPVEQHEVWAEREGNWLGWGLHLHSCSGPCESRKPLTTYSSAFQPFSSLIVRILFLIFIHCSFHVCLLWRELSAGVLCDRANPAMSFPPVFAPMSFLTLLLCSSCPPMCLSKGGVGTLCCQLQEGIERRSWGWWTKASLCRVLQVSCPEVILRESADLFFFFWGKMITLFLI